MRSRKSPNRATRWPMRSSFGLPSGEVPAARLRTARTRTAVLGGKRSGAGTVDRQRNSVVTAWDTESSTRPGSQVRLGSTAALMQASTWHAGIRAGPDDSGLVNLRVQRLLRGDGVRDRRDRHRAHAHRQRRHDSDDDDQHEPDPSEHALTYPTRVGISSFRGFARGSGTITAAGRCTGREVGHQRLSPDRDAAPIMSIASDLYRKAD